MRNGVTEQELNEKAKGERVTLADVEASIASEFYFTAGQGVLGESEMGTAPAGIAASLNLLTICTLVLKNGWTILGKSACADPSNFNEELGRRLAKADAVDQIWPLLGYELKTKVFERAAQAERTEEAQPTTGNAEGAGTTSVNLDLAWQSLARDTRYIDAIRQYRADYKATLKDAHDVVMAWVQRNPVVPLTWFDRVKQERDLLKEKHKKLSAYTLTDGFNALPKLDRQDLHTQEWHMCGYLHALERRIARHERDQQEKATAAAAFPVAEGEVLR